MQKEKPSLLIFAFESPDRELNNMTDTIRAESVVMERVCDSAFRAEHRAAELEKINQSLQNEISIRKRAEKRIQRLNRELSIRAMQLQSINAELKAFCYSVSHDLKAPVRTITGFTQALAEDCEKQMSGDCLNYLSHISAAGFRLEQLIDDMLKLSQLARLQMNITSVDLSALVEDIAKRLLESRPERSVRFTISRGLRAKGDVGLIRIALENLLQNAWKFSGKRSDAAIEFSCRCQKEKKIYYVRDNGVGFDMTYDEKLFGVFQRLHKPDEFEGSGIGLATVRRIIHRHGGRVWAEAAVGKGATFYFTLP